MTPPIQAPLTGATATRRGPRLYRKQVLKKGTIDYKGSKVTFDDAYCNQLAASFNAGAFDSVPLIFATEDNRHNSDPDRIRGDVKGLELTEDGVDALVELTDKGEEIVSQYPKLGVSARLVSDLHRADGKTFPAAIEHVLATVNPRLNGLRGWEPINLSNETEPVVNLTAAQYVNPQGEATVPELTEEELAKLRELLANQTAPPEPAKPAAPVGVITPPAPPALATDPEIDPEMEAAIAEIMANESQPVAAGTELSAETLRALELAQANEDQRAIELSALRTEVDAERFRRESAELLAAGVPPRLIELSRPLLEGSNRVIDLANGSKVDAGVVIRAVLDELKGTIDLSGEFGGRTIGNTTTDEPTAAKDMVAEFQKTYGRAQ